MRIFEYEHYLAGCRFCPMCKPFGEVSSAIKDESHSTRVRGMLLWQVANGIIGWNQEISKIVYESSLNSVNQAWCINHYPVPEYILAARADLVEDGLAPPLVHNYTILNGEKLAEKLTAYSESRSDMIFYPGDSLAANDEVSAIAFMKLAKSTNQKMMLPQDLYDSGALAYCLGRIDLATEQAKKVTESLSNAKTIIVDGPVSLWALTRIYPELGFNLFSQTNIRTVEDWLIVLMRQGQLKPNGEPAKVYPVGSEFSRLAGEGYAPFRNLLKLAAWLEVIEPYDRLELAHSSGAGGGLHLVAPKLALAVSKQRVEEALEIGVDWIVCNSPLDATHLRSVAKDGLRVGTIPELWSLVE